MFTENIIYSQRTTAETSLNRQLWRGGGVRGAVLTWAEKPPCRLNMEVFRQLRKVLEHLQSSAWVPLSKGPNPEMLIKGPTMNWQLIQGRNPPASSCVPKRDKAVKETVAGTWSSLTQEDQGLGCVFGVLEHFWMSSRSKLLFHSSSLILATGMAKLELHLCYRHAKGLHPRGRRDPVGGFFAFLTLQESQRQRGAVDVCVRHLAEWIHWRRFFLLYYVKFRAEWRLSFHRSADNGEKSLAA